MQSFSSGLLQNLPVDSGFFTGCVVARLRRGAALFCCLLLAAGGAVAKAHGQSAQPTVTHKTATHKPGAAASTSAKQTGAKSTSTKRASTKRATTKRQSTRRRHVRPRASRAVRTARTARIRQAFIASSELRPMAQQLATLRTPQAYAGVTAYAHKHTGDAAAAAYLALGHGYLLDHRYSEAVENFRLPRQNNEDLADVAAF